MNKKFVLLISILAYFSGILWGFFFEIPFVGKHQHSLPPKTENYLQLDYFNTFIYLMKNNLYVIYFNICIGSLTLGIFSFVYTFYNGLVLGYIFEVSYRVLGVKQTLNLILPHSIELVAIIWSCYIGFIISYKILKEDVLEKEIDIKWKNILSQILICSLIIVIAAFLESYVSMR